jgi:hypothetical protein
MNKELTFLGDMMRDRNNPLRRYMLGLQTKSGVAESSIISFLDNQLSLSTQNLMYKEAETFCRVYERPSDRERMLNKRKNYANEIFNNWSTYYS